MKNLVIVESLAKAKTIEKYLNTSKKLKDLGSFKVLASFGHVENLPKEELGIDIDNGFSIKYKILNDKKKIADDLKSKASHADVVWLASDADYEGEKIADSLKTLLKLKKYNRVTFTEITQKALEAALLQPRKINELMVDAQETRRILDRLVGYKLSPILWKKYNSGGKVALSAGRVQSAVMHALIQREKDIEEFQSESYWYVIGSFNIHAKVDDVKLHKAGRVYKVDNLETASTLLTDIRNIFSIKGIKTKQVKQYPDAPYITSSFQQDAFSKLGLSIKRSMQIAQDLYENGHITYMRTDSYHISDVFKAAAQAFVKGKYGETYWDGVIRKKNAKSAQEAHEAIRPTHIDVMSLESMTADHRKVYELIWKRTVASLLKPAIFDEITVEIVDKSFEDDMYFLATIKKLHYNGYLIVYGMENDKYDVDNIKASIKTVTCNNIVAKNTWTSPPTRYNDSSLVKMMETEGIGRPSTYASIIQKLVEKNYVVKTDIPGDKKTTKDLIYKLNKKLTQESASVVIGAEKGRMVPTDIGMEIDVYLSSSFPYIIDSKFTSMLECDLDLIAEGEKRRLDVLNLFWNKFGKDVAKEGGDIRKGAKTQLKAQSNNILVDDVNYIVREAKYGPVIEFGEKQYIGLTQYLKYVKKSYLDINENDIRFLTKFPIMKTDSSGKKVTFHLGPYGLYMKSESGNHKIPYKVILDFIKASGDISSKTITNILTNEVKNKFSRNANSP